MSVPRRGRVEVDIVGIGGCCSSCCLLPLFLPPRNGLPTQIWMTKPASRL